jgi:signal transduction histidine kinase
MPANDPLDPGRERLVPDLATQAGPVLRNVRLIEELRASRQRLVAARDEERHRLERNIHDGAQQQLVALAVKARLARTLGEKDPTKALDILDQLEGDLSTTLEDLQLSDGAGELRFEISDDGAGFDPASTGYGTGLQGLRDRLDAVGGSLEIRSAPGAGTTTVGRIPARAADV